MTSSAQSLAEARKVVGTVRVSLIRASSIYLIAESLRMLTMSPFTGISYLQQSITGKSDPATETGAQGDTSHHTAVDEAHPEIISEFLRDQNKSLTKEEGNK